MYNTVGLAALNAAASRFGRKSLPITSVAPMSKYEIQGAQIQSLRKMIGSTKPSVNNHDATATAAIPASSTNNTLTINVTSGFTGSTNYEKLVLGDRFVNKKIQLRVAFEGNDADSTGLVKARIVVYWARKPGTSFVPTEPTSIPDPAAFTVLYDRMQWPLQDSANLSNNTNTITIPLRDRITVFNQSSSVIEAGELKILIMTDNNAITAKGIRYEYRLFVANK
jgi:hypothetical protein